MDWYASASRFVLLSIAVTSTGCGAKSEDVSISGNVSYAGQPISNGAVTFYPAKGRPIVVATDESGVYSAMLNPGEYQVTLATSVKLPPGWKEGDPVPKQDSIVPAEFSTRARTPLKATVSASQSEPIDFVLP